MAIKILEAIKLVGNASQAMAIYDKVMKVDKKGVIGKPDLQELIDEAKGLPGDLDNINKRCLRMFALYEGLIESIDEILKPAPKAGK